MRAQRGMAEGGLLSLSLTLTLTLTLTLPLTLTLRELREKWPKVIRRILIRMRRFELRLRLGHPHLGFGFGFGLRLGQPQCLPPTLIRILILILSQP